VPEENIQQLADRVNLGPHQHLIEAQDETGQVQKFVVHRPTLREQVKIAVETSSLTALPTTAKDGEVTVGATQIIAPVFLGLAEAIATLNTVVEMRPPGIPADVGEWRDDTLTWNVYSAYLEWVDYFRSRLQPAGGTDSSTPEPAATGLAV
jgi:hypothetical protein